MFSHERKYRRSPFVFPLVILLCLALPSPATADNIEITYTAKTDQLAIRATEAPLSKVMQEISKQTGVRIRVDEAADLTVSLAIAERPLEDALKQIVKTYQLNNMFLHSINDGNATLVEVKILPKGSSTAAVQSNQTTTGAVPTDEERIEAKRKRAEEKEKERQLATEQRNQQMDDYLHRTLPREDDLQKLSAEERRQQRQQKTLLGNIPRYPNLLEGSESTSSKDKALSNRDTVPGQPHKGFFSQRLMGKNQEETAPSDELN